jgi:hypothetical protein
MDIDAFVATHQYSWVRLGDLTQRARKLKSVSPEAIVGGLTYLVAGAHAILYGRRETNVRRSVTRFLALTFPQPCGGSGTSSSRAS